MKRYKLFRVNLVGLTGSTGIHCNPSYVIAEDSAQAYKTVRDYLDKKDYGFEKERELKSVELIADEKEYADCGAMLFYIEVLNSDAGEGFVWTDELVKEFCYENGTSYVGPDSDIRTHIELGIEPFKKSKSVSQKEREDEINKIKKEFQDKKDLITKSSLEETFRIQRESATQPKEHSRDWEIVQMYDGLQKLPPHPIKNDCKPFECKIYSVRRLPDGEVFCIGDEIKIYFGGRYELDGARKITGFQIKTGMVVLHESGDSKLSDIQKFPSTQPATASKEVLFVTEDGKEIRQGDEYWAINIRRENERAVSYFAHNKPSPELVNLKFFSTEDAAYRYVNKIKVTKIGLYKKYVDPRMTDQEIRVELSVPINAEGDISKIKKAIEGCLNEENDFDERFPIIQLEKLTEQYREMLDVLGAKKYTQEFLDKAIEDARIEGFTAAREKDLFIVGPSPAKYPTLQDYLKSKK